MPPLNATLLIGSKGFVSRFLAGGSEDLAAGVAVEGDGAFVPAAGADEATVIVGVMDADVAAEVVVAAEVAEEMAAETAADLAAIVDLMAATIEDFLGEAVGVDRTDVAAAAAAKLGAKFGAVDGGPDAVLAGEKVGLEVTVGGAVVLAGTVTLTDGAALTAATAGAGLGAASAALAGAGLVADSGFNETEVMDPVRLVRALEGP